MTGPAVTFGPVLLHVVASCSEKTKAGDSHWTTVLCTFVPASCFPLAARGNPPEKLFRHSTDLPCTPWTTLAGAVHVQGHDVMSVLGVARGPEVGRVMARQVRWSLGALVPHSMCPSTPYRQHVAWMP